jgi:hypothetical protein
MPIIFTISEQVAGPLLIKVDRIEARMIEEIMISIGCGGLSPVS